MANILDRYGIKEVADVTFYKLENGIPTQPVLFLDTLKVSTIEQTAETSEAKGGKGNTSLIAWDYGKEINVTLEDALFSAKSMAIMFGNGKIKAYNGGDACIMKTETFTATGTGALPVEGTSSLGWNSKYEGPNGETYLKLNPQFYNADGTSAASLVSGQKYFCTFDIAVDGSVIEVSASSFPGTYYVTGDTFARSEADGADEFFQFIIPKAKVLSQNTITLQAEGDPSTFNMSLRVLRPEDGVMMRLVKYNGINATPASEGGNTAELIHNHVMNDATTLDKTAVTMNHASGTIETVRVINAKANTGVSVTSGDVTAVYSNGIITITSTASAAGSAVISVKNGTDVTVGTINVTLS